MSLVQSLPNSSEPRHPDISQFTCISCQVAFTSCELQRTHYRTDWHKYNLKRKIAELSPVTPQQFNEKVLAQQAKGQEEMERAAIAYYCAVCRKTYGTEPAYENHMRSKKHKEFENQQEILSHHDTPLTAANNEAATATATATMEDNDVALPASLQCLFCNKKHSQFDTNLHHMSKDHGFFLPDVEYLSDAEGLVSHLSKKVKYDLVCLYCIKEFKSAHATMTHMVDKGHCKMAYDDSEDVDALLQYYDFGTLADDYDDDQVTSTESNQYGELVLQNGARLGNRHLLQRCKQKQKQQRFKHTKQDNERNDSGDHAVNDDDDTPNLSITAVMDQHTMQQQDAESLKKNRYERRHPNMAITSGQLDAHQNRTGAGIHEAAKKNAYQYQVGIKQNANNTQRLRPQIPI